MLVWNKLVIFFFAFIRITSALPVGGPSGYVAERAFVEDVEVVYVDKRDNQVLDAFFTLLNKTGFGVNILHTLYSSPLTRPTVLNLVNGFIKQVDFDTLLSELSSSGLAHDVAILFFYNDKAFPGLWAIISELRKDGTIAFKRELHEKRSILGDIVNGVGNAVGGVVGALTGGSSSSASASGAAPASSAPSAASSAAPAVSAPLSGDILPTSVVNLPTSSFVVGSILDLGGDSATAASTVSAATGSATGSSTPTGSRTTSVASTTSNGGLFGFIGGLFGDATSEVGSVVSGVGSVVSGVGSAVGSVATGAVGAVDGALNTTTTSINSLLLSSLQVDDLNSLLNAQQIAAVATLLQLFQANKNMGDWIIALQKSGLGVLIVQDVVTTTDGQSFAVAAAQSIKKNAPQPLKNFIDAIWSSGFLVSVLFQFLNIGDILTIVRYLASHL